MERCEDEMLPVSHSTMNGGSAPNTFAASMAPNRAPPNSFQRKWHLKGPAVGPERDHKCFLDRDNSVSLAAGLPALREYRKVLTTRRPADSADRRVYLAQCRLGRWIPLRVNQRVRVLNLDSRTFAAVPSIPALAKSLGHIDGCRSSYICDPLAGGRYCASGRHPCLPRCSGYKSGAVESTRHSVHLHLQREFGRFVGRGSIRVFIEASVRLSRAEALSYQGAGTARSYSHSPFISLSRSYAYAPACW